VIGPSTRPIATDAHLWRGRSIHTAYCYRRAAVSWSVHRCGLFLQPRSSVAWSVHPHGLFLQPRSCVVWSVHLRDHYSRAAVAGTVRPCGLLLQTHSSGVVGTSTRPIVTDAQLWRGLTIHATYCYWGCGRTTGWPTYRLCLAVVVFWHKMSSF